MKIVLKLVLFAALSMMAADAFAQKFGHISRDELLGSMPEIKTAQETLETYRKELATTLDEMRVELNKKYEEFTNEGEKWSQEQKDAKTKEIQDLGARFENQQKDAEEKMNKKQEEVLGPIMQKAGAAIQKVAKDGGFIYIFEAGSFYYIDEAQSTNILPLVKKELGF